MEVITPRKIRSDKFLFTDCDIKKIEKMAAFGLSIKQISSIFGVSTDTFYRRCSEENIDLSAAVMRGKAKATCKVAQKCFQLAMAGDTSMIKYWLSSVGGWSEKLQITPQADPEMDMAQYGVSLMEGMSNQEIEAIRRIADGKFHLVDFDNN